MRTAILLLLVLDLWAGAAAPPRIAVLPVFFVPAGEIQPASARMAALMRRLVWTHSRYSEMLGGIGNPLRVRLANGSGRYVRIVLRSPNEYLHWDEVEVYGSPAANQP